METYRDSPTTHVNNRIQKSSKNNTVLEDIISEYCLKRNTFNPHSPSPNIFVTKLEQRMRMYYNSLYSSSKRHKVYNSK